MALIQVPAAQAGGMTLLSSGSISSSGIDLQSISGSYEQLRLKLMDIDVSTNANIWVRFNNDSGSNYYRVLLRTQNTTSGTAADSGATLFALNYDAVSGTAGGTIGIIDLPNYQDSIGYKVVNATLNNVDGSGTNASTLLQGFWKNENAIDRITFNCSTGTFDAGATYELWGIK